MAHTYRNKSQTSDNGNPITHEHTPGAAATVIVLSIVIAGTTTRAGGDPTIDGTTATQFDEIRSVSDGHVECWYVCKAFDGSAVTISIPNTGGLVCYIEAVSADAGTGYASELNSASGGTAPNSTDDGGSVDVTSSATGDFLYARLGCGEAAVGSVTEGSGSPTKTLTYANDHGAFTSFGYYAISDGAGTETFSWTWTNDVGWWSAAAFKSIAAGVLFSASITGASSTAVAQAPVTRLLSPSSSGISATSQIELGVAGGAETIEFSGNVSCQSTTTALYLSAIRLLSLSAVGASATSGIYAPTVRSIGLSIASATSTSNSIAETTREIGASVVGVSDSSAPSLDIAWAAVILSASDNIAAGATTDTTAQLVAPSGKDGGDFQAGKISDDTNPIGAIDPGADIYLEVEWCLKLTDGASIGDVYQFRVTDAGVPIDTYTVVPEITVSTGAAKEFSASVVASSSTASPSLAVERPLVVSVGCQTETTGVAVSLLRLLSAAVTVVTTTATGALSISRTLAETIIGATTTSEAISIVLRPEAPVLTAASTVSSPSLDITWAAIVLSASDNIAAGATTDTTAQLTAPSGKDAGDFQAGKISDDTNPLASIDPASGVYLELEWCLKLTEGASVGDIYQFRVTLNGTPIDSYTLIPQITVSSAAVKEFTAAIAAASTSADSVLAVLRLLSMASAGESATAQIDLAVVAAGVIEFLSQITAASSTGLSAATVTRPLQGSIAGTSATTSAISQVLRLLMVSPAGTSTTAEVNLTVLVAGIIEFFASVAAASSAGPSVAAVTRPIWGSISGISATADSVSSITRALMGAIASISQTGSADLQRLVSFTAALAANSQTTTCALAMLRALSVAAAGNTLTADTIARVLREIGTSYSVSTVTAAVILITGGLGIIVNPEIESLTQLRILESLTSELELESISWLRRMVPVTSDLDIESATTRRTIH